MRVLFTEGLVASNTMPMYFFGIHLSCTCVFCLLKVLWLIKLCLCISYTYSFICACLFVCTSVLFVLCLLASNTLLMCLLLTYIILVDMFMGKFELFGENILPNNVLCLY